jgi:hypothetical protein
MRQEDTSEVSALCGSSLEEDDLYINIETLFVSYEPALAKDIEGERREERRMFPQRLPFYTSNTARTTPDQWLSEVGFVYYSGRIP